MKIGSIGSAFVTVVPAELAPTVTTPALTPRPDSPFARPEGPRDGIELPSPGAFRLPVDGDGLEALVRASAAAGDVVEATGGARKGGATVTPVGEPTVRKGGATVTPVGEPTVRKGGATVTPVEEPPVRKGGAPVTPIEEPTARRGGAPVTPVAALVMMNEVQASVLGAMRA